MLKFKNLERKMSCPQYTVASKRGRYRPCEQNRNTMFILILEHKCLNFVIVNC